MLFLLLLLFAVIHYCYYHFFLILCLCLCSSLFLLLLFINIICYYFTVSYYWVIIYLSYINVYYNYFTDWFPPQWSHLTSLDRTAWRGSPACQRGVPVPQTCHDLPPAPPKQRVTSRSTYNWPHSDRVNPGGWWAFVLSNSYWVIQILWEVRKVLNPISGCWERLSLKG